MVLRADNLFFFSDYVIKFFFSGFHQYSFSSGWELSGPFQPLAFVGKYD